MSKAEYLKRYTEGADSKSKEKRRKKRDANGGLKVLDTEQDEWGQPRGGGDMGVWGHDDAPAVVDAAEVTLAEGAKRAVKGSWAPVASAAPNGAPKSDSDSDEAPPRRASARHDSDTDEAPPRCASARHDSDSDGAPPRRGRANDSNINNAASVAVSVAASAPVPSQKKTLASSGHTAGLQSGAEFRKNEQRLQAEKKALSAGVDDSKNGKNAETVYRDRKGKKLDMLNEFMRQQAIEEGKAVRLEKATYDWGKGTVQKESAQDAKRELEILAAEPFARMADDPRMEALKKNEIRDGDPMAEYFAKKQREEGEEGVHSEKGDSLAVGTKARRPVYKGPAPPPNRFNILPGYRWDGNDRGNQWESKILKAANYRTSLKGDRDQWSMQDM